MARNQAPPRRDAQEGFWRWVLDGGFGGKEGCQDGRREEEGGWFKRFCRVQQGVRRGFTLAQLLTRHLEREVKESSTSSKRRKNAQVAMQLDQRGRTIYGATRSGNSSLFSATSFG